MVLTAGLFSTSGSSISSVCLIWIVWTFTGSAMDIAFLGTSSVIAGISFSVAGGTAVDRFNRKHLMILSDLARATALALIFVSLKFTGFNLLEVLVLNFALSSFSVVFRPAEQTVIPTTVVPEQLSAANALVRSSRQVVVVMATSLGGGFIITIGAVNGIALNSLTFAVSAVFLMGLKLNSQSRRDTTEKSSPRNFLSDAISGFRWLYRARGLFEMTLSAMAFNFPYTIINTFLVIFVSVVLRSSALTFAFLISSDAAGTIVGSVLVGKVNSVRWAGKAWTLAFGVGAALMALCLVLINVLPAAAVAAMFAIGCFTGFAGTSWLTAAQLLVPEEMFGRFYGVDYLGAASIVPVAQIAGAFLVGASGVRETFIISGVIWLILGLLFILPRASWRLGYPSVDEDMLTYRH